MRFAVLCSPFSVGLKFFKIKMGRYRLYTFKTVKKAITQ